MNDSPVIVGKITGVYGVKGWVKVFSYTQPRLNILTYDPWLLKQGGSWQPLNLLQGREQGKTIVAQIEGIDDRNQAEALTGVQVAIKPSQLVDLEDDGFYWRDLEGLKVVNEEGKLLGQVSHLIETGANDVMIVKILEGKNRRETMIPYIMQQVIKRVDLDNQVIEVDWDDEYL